MTMTLARAQANHDAMEPPEYFAKPDETPEELLANAEAYRDHLTDQAADCRRKLRTDLAHYRVLMRSLEEQRGVVARMKEGL